MDTVLLKAIIDGRVRELVLRDVYIVSQLRNNHILVTRLLNDDLIINLYMERSLMEEHGIAARERRAGGSLS